MGACGGGGGGSTPVNPVAPSPSTAPAPQPTATPTWRPNIVILTADDLDVLSIDRMPTLRAELMNRGLTFTNGFATTPLCCPSRASMMTGQYAHNHGILINRNPNTFGVEPNCFEKFRNAGQERQTFATWMQDAGYTTGFVGKYLNRYPGDMPDADPTYIPPGWDDWFAQVSDNAYYRYVTNDNGTMRNYENRPADYLTDPCGSSATRPIPTSRSCCGSRPPRRTSLPRPRPATWTSSRTPSRPACPTSTSRT
jgi:hypothetical protein